jgi:hypothetical protein
LRLSLAKLRLQVSVRASPFSFSCLTSCCVEEFSTYISQSISLTGRLAGLGRYDPRELLLPNVSQCDLLSSNSWSGSQTALGRRLGRRSGPRRGRTTSGGSGRRKQHPAGAVGSGVEQQNRLAAQRPRSAFPGLCHTTLRKDSASLGRDRSSLGE